MQLTHYSTVLGKIPLLFRSIMNRDKRAEQASEPALEQGRKSVIREPPVFM